MADDNTENVFALDASDDAGSASINAILQEMQVRAEELRKRMDSEDQNDEAGLTDDSAFLTNELTTGSESNSGAAGTFVRLTRAVVFIAIFAIIFGAIVGIARASNAPKGITLAEVQQATGTIICYDADGSQLSRGSGFVISKDGYIATAFHCITDGGLYNPTASAMFVFNYGEGTEKVCAIEFVAGYSETLDVAIVKIDATDMKLKPIPLGDSNKVKIGDDGLYVFGTPEGLRSLANSAVSANVSKIGNEYGLQNIQLSTSSGAVPGVSGGPVIAPLKSNKKKYNAVGIISTMYVQSKINTAVPINYIVENYIEEEQRTISDVNGYRDSFVNEYQDEKGRLLMGERFSVSETGVQNCSLARIKTEGERQWLVDAFIYDESTATFYPKGLIVDKTEEYYSVSEHSLTETDYFSLSYYFDLEIPKWYYGQYDADGISFGYTAQLQMDGKGFLYNTIDKVDKLVQGPGIMFTDFGTSVYFAEYKDGRFQGIVPHYQNNSIFVYSYEQGMKSGKATRFDTKSAKFYAGVYKDDELQGSWTEIPSTDVSHLVYTPDSYGDKSAGQLEWAEQKFSFQWWEYGARFEMESPSQFATCYKDEDDGKARFDCKLKSNNPNAPYVRVHISDSESIWFYAQLSDCTGYARKDGTHLAMYSPYKKRFAYVLTGSTEKWQLGEYTDNWYMLNGKGSEFYPQKNEMYIGEFLDDEPEGYGVWLGRSTMPLRGRWYSDRITSITWSNIEYEEPSAVSLLWSKIFGKVIRGKSDIA